MGVALHPSHGHNHGGGHGHSHEHKSAPSTPTLPTKVASLTGPATAEAGTVGVEAQPTSQTLVAAPQQQHHRANINVRAAFIHVVGDLLQSIGVFIAALTIYFKPTWIIVDPICTFLFSVLVLITTCTIIKDTIVVLMEGPGVNPTQVLKTATRNIHTNFNFFEMTLQIEEFHPNMEDCTECNDTKKS